MLKATVYPVILLIMVAGLLASKRSEGTQLNFSMTETDDLGKAAIPSLSPSPPEPIKKKWGAYTGWGMNDLAEFEAKIGSEADMQATFVHWGNESEFPLYLTPGLKEKSKKLVIFWEAMDYNLDPVNQPNYNYDAILRGDWNDYLRSFAESVKAYEGEVILIPFEEMNGNWYAWSGTVNGNTPEKHKQAFRYVRSFFNEVKNVKFAWDVNVTSEPNTPENAMENYYPGDKYVDYLGVNGFNFGDPEPWMSFREIFDTTLRKLEMFNKPVFIFSMASADGPGKAEWIRQGLGEDVYNYANLKGWIWFNEDKEKDWRVWSDEEALKAFQEVVR